MSHIRPTPDGPPPAHTLLLKNPLLWATAAVAALVLFGPGGESRPDDRGTDEMAQVQCKNHVRDRLRSPASAEFPFMADGVTEVGTRTFRVSSYVDAQNGFGATLRSYYVCTVQFEGGDSGEQRNWNLLDLTMQ
jgi:hypothetical protein